MRQAAVSTSQSHDLYPEKKLDRDPGIDHLPYDEEKELMVSVNISEKRKEPTGLQHLVIFPQLLNFILHLSLLSAVGGGGDDAFNTFLGGMT